MKLVTIEVPRLWLKLLRINQIPPEAKKASWNRTDDLDPNPYREDLRTATGIYEDGYRAELQLCSGQENYWVEVDVYGPDDHIVFSSDAQDSLGEGRMDISGTDIPDRDVVIRFVGERETDECELTLKVTYDPALTDPESLATALDRLLETATSTPGILDEYGNPSIGTVFVKGQEP